MLSTFNTLLSTLLTQHLCDLHEADSFFSHLPTAKAVGYASTAPTGLAPSTAAHYFP